MLTMIRFIAITLFSALVAGAPSYDDVTIGQLPIDIAEELEYMVTNIFFDLKPNCTNLQQPDVGFLLYTRNNPNDPIPLDPTNPHQIDPRKKLLLVVHGWMQSPNALGISKLRAEYIKRYDVNFVAIDWSKAAWLPYTKCFCHVPKIGERIADLLCILNQEYKVRLNVVHLIGHSFGGQIAGYVGQYLISKCNNQKLGRITGLDPVGPLYRYEPESVRLDLKDAEFVDVIHTDTYTFGHGANCGAVDFHPNCALLQPGCTSIKVVDNDTLVSDVLCSPHRSLDYMAESVNSEELIGVSCSLCSRYCHPDIINEVYQVMGENCRQIPKPAKNFLLPTNNAPPYGRGMDAYPMWFSRTGFCQNVNEATNRFLRKMCKV